MKRKILVLTLCFTIIFTSINYKKSYAFDGGIISVPMLATISSLAVASGIVLSSDDDVFDIGRVFYNKYRDRWDEVQQVFDFCVTVGSNKVVTVGKDFLDLVKGCFDDVFGNTSSNIVTSGYLSYGSNKNYPIKLTKEGNAYFIGYKTDGSPLYVHIIKDKSTGYLKVGWDSSSVYNDYLMMSVYDSYSVGTYYLWLTGSGSSTRLNFGNGVDVYQILNRSWSLDLDYMSIPYTGTYNPGGVLDKDDNLDIYVPGNLGVLPGLNSDNVLNNPTYDLPVGGVVTLPGVNNPSIDYDDTISFPITGDTDIPDTDVPGNDIIVPSFPSFGDSLDFSPMYLTNVTEKFPFSLPWDIGRLINKFDVDPVAPVFDVPVFSETITLDLTEFSELASIVRFFVLIGFILSLIFISTKLMA